ncbi:MAG TPA: hypothetical protein VNA13_05185 [Xanthomonadales bacterium]|nr:hypothetical protein [Xanthomonadales bacterium]
MLTKNDIQQIREVVREEVKDEVSQQLKDQLKPLSRKLNRVQKDLSYVIGDYDERIVLAHKRIDRVEKHVGSPQTG